MWVGKCLHCDTRLALAEDGEPISRATVEHIVPRSAGGTDDPASLAIACARCTHEKGRRWDPRYATDPRAREIAARLLVKRRRRWRDPDGEARVG